LDEAAAVMDLSDQVFARLVAQVPQIDLGPIEFCKFDDMHVFSPLRVFN